MKPYIILICSLITVAILHLFYFGYYRYPKIDYSEMVNNEKYIKLVKLTEKSDKIRVVHPEHEQSSQNKLNTLEWLDYEVRLIWKSKDENGAAYEFPMEKIEFKKSDSNDWNTLDFSKDDKDKCRLLFTINEKLYCKSDNFKLFILSNLSDSHSVKLFNESSPSSNIGMYLEDKKNLWFIWSDSRARWYNANAFTIVGDYSGDIMDGPWLVMAGKLNLDTLEFEEYVIKYDSQEFP